MSLAVSRGAADPTRRSVTARWPTGRATSTNQSSSIDSSHIGVRFTLTATGQTSGKTAQATFTDATKTVQASTTVSPIAASITAILYNASGPAALAGDYVARIVQPDQYRADDRQRHQHQREVGQADRRRHLDRPRRAARSSTGQSPPAAPSPRYSGEPLAICVPGTNGNQTDTFQPVYVTTSTSVVSSVNPSVFGQSVTFTATVTVAHRRHADRAR